MSEPAGGFQDPEEVFGKMFGGDRFDDLIGQISIGECDGFSIRGTRYLHPIMSITCH